MNELVLAFGFRLPTLVKGSVLDQLRRRIQLISETCTNDLVCKGHADRTLSSFNQLFLL